jgi:uncharacterized iron-regulated membrane protein
MSEQRSARGFRGGFRQSMTWLHTWVGLVLGVVLYFMFITGSFGYFHDEIDRWMRPELPAQAALPTAPQMAERGVERLQQRMPDARGWYVSMPEPRAVQAVSIYGEPQPVTQGPEPDPLEEVLDPATGAPFVGVRATGGADLLYRMHYALHYIPYDVAIYIVGVATMFMFIAIVTGIVVHKKIFKDFFTFRPAKGQRSWLDAHNLSSVMALPFFIVITYSGLVFYTYEYLPSVKWAAYGIGEAGDKAMAAEQDAEYSAAEPEPAGRATPLVPIAPLVAQAEARWGAGEVGFLMVRNPGDAHARVRIDRRDPPGQLSRRSEMLVFDGASGALLQASTPGRGSADQVFADTALALHEGLFAGPLLRWLYFASGLLGAAMIATGLVLWTSKRRQKLKVDERAHAGVRFVERFNVGIVAGLPISVAVYFWANRMLPAQWEARADWEIHALFIAWALTLLHAALRSAARAWQEQWWTAALLCALLPLLNAATTNIHLGRTIPAGDWALASVDLTALVIGFLFGVVALRLRGRKARKAADLSPAKATEATEATEATGNPT